MAQQGYLGWLLTSRSFIDELRAFWLSYRQMSSTNESVPIGVAWHAQAGGLYSNPTPETKQLPANRLVDQFCRRWRLTQVVAPLTMRPLSTQFPVMLPLLSAAQSQFSGSLLFIPDIAPLPDRDELRQMTEDVVRQAAQASPHLSEWFEIVRAGSPKLKTVYRFSRWLALQHYLRVIHCRYGSHLNGIREPVEVAVGFYLKLTPDQLRDDLKAIRSKLGRYWLTAESCRFLKD